MTERIKSYFKGPFQKNTLLRKVIFIIAAALCLFPFVSPPTALLMGIIIAQIIGNPYLHLNNKATHLLLQISVVGLGFGMNIKEAIHAGSQGFLFTIFSIVGTLTLGLGLAKAFKLDKITSYLISVGTAICGGSAIAAVSPVVQAKEKQISIALGIVFILNSIALFVFPVVGNILHLSQQQFGLWCAIAIHDTSSVVGAAAKYGNEALEIATTVKLARALWIIPVALLSATFFKQGKGKVKIPYFIGYFIIAMCINSYSPWVLAHNQVIVTIAKAGLTLTLFLIGSGLSKKVLKSVGLKPMLQGLILWTTISLASLSAIYYL
ncbi:putative sulfate exporter family transporter [Fulvivirga maritima]|uniref:YeiH family protein n=1 Tax=Fulvivirga maritima TaxID=2904247 RepID=UPI001F1AF052|nr:putative sulfate exporter family transporter [Fulvivirga maritima]UII27473.1 putative sulfate exporter family transporter [Fulvivirga maritima]